MRLSVTELDAYRRYCDDEGFTLEALLRQLRREEPPTEAMRAGRALHHILEHAKPGQELEDVEHDGFRFIFELDCAMPLPRVRELKGETLLPTAIGPATLVGVVDGLDCGVRDYKLTARLDAERYADSYQWRCYLMMFAASMFQYDAFVGGPNAAGWYVITEYHPIRFYAYPGMQEDVLREVSEFADFASRHLPERLAAPVAA
jgi:hypothetical protein